MKKTEQTWLKAVELCEKVHGKGASTGIAETFAPISSRLADYCMSWIFGDLYNDSVLSIKQRELLNIAGLVVSGDLEPQLQNHISAAKRNGATQEEIKETILQMIIIIGFPKVVNAMLVADQIFKENK